MIKKSPLNPAGAVTLAIVLMGFVVAGAQAQTNLFYDANGTTNGIGGTGNWTTTGTTWTTNPAGTSTTVSGGWTNGAAWSNNTANNAILQGTAGTVSLSSSTVFANQIQVNTTGFTIQNSSTGTTSQNRYFRTKNGIVLADGANLNISSGVGTNGTSGALTGFEGPIVGSNGTNSVSTNSSITVVGNTTDTNGSASSVRIAFDTSASDVVVPVNVATTGSGYALFTVSGTATVSIYGPVNVSNGSRLVVGHAGMTSARRMNLRGNLTTVNTDLVIGEAGNTGIVGLYGTNSIGGSVVVRSGSLGYGSTNAFGSSSVVLSNGAIFGQIFNIGSNAVTERTIGNKISIQGNVTFGLGSQGNYFGGEIDLGGTTRVITLSNSTTVSGIITNGGLTITDSNGSTRTLTLSANNTFSGPTVISNGGRLAVSGSIASSASVTAETGGGLGYANTNAFGTNTIVLKSGSTFGQIDGMGTNIAERTIANNLNLQGDVTFGFGTYGNYFGGGMDLGGVINRNIYLTNSTVINGVISNGGLVVNDTIDGTNDRRLTMTIASTSTFTGPTVLAGGLTNVVTGVTTNFVTNGSVVSTNFVTNTVPVAYGPILLVTGSLASSDVTVQTNATLAGTGSVSNVTVQAGGELSPGDATAAPITVNGNLTLQPGSTADMRILSLADYDRVVSSTTTTLNGTVNVSLSTNFAPAAGTFQLFSGAVSGSPTLVVPPLTDTNLTWVTNAFATTGAISIASVTPPATGYSSWLTNYSTLTGSNAIGTADPDSDGFNNNLEYAFDGNPTVGTPALLTAAVSGSNFVGTFLASTNGAAVSYSVESTTDLSAGGWSNNSAATLAISNSSNQTDILLSPAYVRREFSAPATNAAGKIFYRIKALITN